MDAAAELGRNPVISTRFSLSMDMRRLTRDGTAEPFSRNQILRHARGQGNIIFPVQLTTSRIGNLTWLIHTLLYVITIHKYIQLNWSMVISAKTAHFLEDYWPCPGGLSAVNAKRYRYAIAWLDIHETDPIANGGINNGRRHGNREESRD